MFDKDDQEISQIIETGLEAIVSGRATLEEVVAQHPEHAAALRSELEVALWLVSRKEQVAPRAGFVAASRKRVVSRIKEEARNKGAKRSIFGFIWPQKVAYQWVAALLALVILFSGTGGLVSFSQSALPGDGLYGVKQASETVALAVTVNEVKKVELSASFAERRVDEVASLIDRGDVTKVDGVLQSFETQVNQTVSMLQNVESASAHDRKQLAVTVKEELTEQAGKLNKLQANASEDVRAQLADAEMMTMLGAEVAGQEAKNIIDPTETPTADPTITETAQPSPMPSVQPSDTPVPEATSTEEVVSPTEEVLNPTEEPSLVPDPTNPSRLVTKTPRPTNENRPTPQPDPGGGNSGGGNSGGGNSGSSGSEDRPVKPDKPEKPEKDK